MTRVGKPKKTKLILFSSLNQYLGIMRSLSEFMNSKLSTYIFGDDKKFLFFKYFRVLDYKEFLKDPKNDEYLNVVVEFSEEILLGRKYQLLNKINEKEGNKLIFVDKIPCSFNPETKVFASLRSKDTVNKEVERILEKPEILSSDDENGEEKQIDKLSTKAPSMINVGDMGEEMIDENEEHKEVNFELNNGFFSFSKYQEPKQETPYGRSIDNWIIQDLKKLNLISNSHPGKNLDANLLHNNSNFDFLDSLVKIEEIPESIQLIQEPLCLDLVGVSEGYSMEIILRNLKANTVVLVNGNENENKKMLELKLNKKKIRALNSEKRIYKGSLHRSRLKAIFTQNEPEDLKFKTLRGEELCYAKVNAKVEVQYDKKTRKIIHKNSLITIMNENEENQNQWLKNKKEGEVDLKYSTLDKFRLIDFKNFLKDEGVDSRVEFGRLNINDKVYVIQNKGELSIDGIFSEDYFKVRRMLYKMMMIKNS